jgi:hypothetical protein
MADNLGPNGLVVAAGKLPSSIDGRKLHFVQKISGSKVCHNIDPQYFLRQQFSAAIEAAHFPD